MPSSHEEYGMIFDRENSLLTLIDEEDPDFWITENVEGFTHVPRDGSDAPIEILQATVENMKDDAGKSRFAVRHRMLDQKDFVKGKRNRSMAISNRLLRGMQCLLNMANFRLTRVAPRKSSGLAHAWCHAYGLHRRIGGEDAMAGVEDRIEASTMHGIRLGS